MKGWISQPCMGCGKSVRRKAVEVCNDCGNKMAYAEAAIASEARHEQKVAYRTKSRDYAIPYFRCSDEIKKALHALSVAVSDPSPAEWFDRKGTPILWPAPPRQTDYDWFTTRMFEPRVATALTAVFVACRSSTEESYIEGHKRGRALLQALVSGEITADKFNEMSIDETGA